MKTLTIDELLGWAFVHELPKGGGVEGLSSIHSSWSEICGLGVRVDRGSSGSAMARDHSNFMIEQGEPNDDALTIGEAVSNLANCEIHIPEDWQPLCDWPADDDRMASLVGEVTRRAVGVFEQRSSDRQAAHLLSLVIGTAVLGKEPAWDAPVPKIRMVEHGGRPAWFIREARRDPLSGKMFMAEVQGYDARAHRPKRGAYRKFEFSDDPMGDVLARLDRELWALALQQLECAVSNRLVAHRIAKSAFEIAPWGCAGGRLRLLDGRPVKAKMTA